MLGRSGDNVGGEYLLVEHLGTGGSGEVWRAEKVLGEESVDVRCAVKLLPLPPDAIREGKIVRGTATGWLDEFRLVQRVGSDENNIVRLTDVGVWWDRNLAFIVMEYLEGKTLADELDEVAEQCLCWRRALEIARNVAKGILACHDAGVLHMDLKPANVYLLERGGLRVLDFGIAMAFHGPARRQLGAPPSLSAATEPTDLELDDADDDDAYLTPTLQGTPGYVPPEFWDNEPPRPTSDAFALGVILFEMIAGHLPQLQLAPRELRARAARLDETRREQRRHEIYVQTRGKTYPRELPSGVPSAVRDLVRRLLDPDPRGRLVGDELRAALDDAWLAPHGRPLEPYRGLSAFGEADCGTLFGRDGDVKAILDIMSKSANRSAFLVGPSGCGKSSLAQAGVFAELDRSMACGCQGWRMLVVRPSGGSSGLRLAEVGQASAGPDRPLGTLVVVDQMEELITAPPADLSAWLAAFRALVSGRQGVIVGSSHIGPGDPVRIVGTLRSDYYAALGGLPDIGKMIEQDLFVDRGVDPNAVRQLLVAPAKAFGCVMDVEDEVVAEAKQLLVEDPGVLPLVQFGLKELWARRVEGHLTRECWQDIGGFRGALAGVAQRLYEKEKPFARLRMEQILVQLFSPDHARTRRAVAEANLASDREGRRILKLLEQHHLVRGSRQPDGTRMIEVVHESLGKNWPVLTRWLDRDEPNRVLLEQLEADAERWQGDDRKSSHLHTWRDKRLERALRLAGREGVHLRGPGMAFLEAAASGERSAKRMRRLGWAVLALVVGSVVIGSHLIRLQVNESGRKRAEAQRAADFAAKEVKRVKQAAETARKQETAANQEAQDAAKQSLNAKIETFLAKIEAARAEVEASHARAEVRKTKDEADVALKEADDKLKEGNEKLDAVLRKVGVANGNARNAEINVANLRADGALELKEKRGSEREALSDVLSAYFHLKAVGETEAKLHEFEGRAILPIVEKVRSLPKILWDESLVPNSPEVSMVGGDIGKADSEPGVPGSEVVVVGTTDGRYGIWDTVGARKRAEGSIGVRLHAIWFTPDASKIIAVTDDGIVPLTWGEGVSSPPEKMPAPSQPAIVSAVISAGHQKIAALRANGQVDLWSVEDASQSGVIAAPEGGRERSLGALSDDGRLLATITRDPPSGKRQGDLEIWRTQPAELRSYHYGAGWRLPLFLPGGETLLAAAGRDAHVLELETGVARIVKDLGAGHVRRISGIGLEASGRFAYTTSLDGSRLWPLGAPGNPLPNIVPGTILGLGLVSKTGCASMGQADTRSLDAGCVVGIRDDGTAMARSVADGSALSWELGMTSVSSTVISTEGNMLLLADRSAYLHQATPASDLAGRSGVRMACQVLAAWGQIGSKVDSAVKSDCQALTSQR